MSADLPEWLRTYFGAPQQPEPEPLQPSQAELFLQMAEALEPVREQVNGWRAKWLKDGYSETAAETMATAFHSYLLQMLLNTSAS